MTERYFGLPRWSSSPGPHRHADPLRQPQKTSAPTGSPTVGAYDLYGGPSIVVDFGTATTVEAISDKASTSATIFPGIEISLDALFGRAAGLRRVELVAAEERDREVDAGVVAVGRDLRVQRAGRRGRRALRGRAGRVTVIATGGLAELIIPHSRTVQHYEPWLTLHGLRSSTSNG